MEFIKAVELVKKLYKENLEKWQCGSSYYA